MRTGTHSGTRRNACTHPLKEGRERVNPALPGVHKMSAGLAKHDAHARCLTLTWVGTWRATNYPPCTESELFAACVLLGDKVRQYADSRLRINPELLGSLVLWFVTHTRVLGQGCSRVC